MSLKSMVACLLVTLASLSPVASQKLNEIIVLGSHNSYHQLDNSRPIISEWKYDHPPLEEQAETHGIVHFEFDIQAFDGMNDFAVVHIPEYDSNSSCSTLRACAQELQTWSASNTNHLTFFVWLEIVVTPADAEQWAALEAILTSVWGDAILTPAELQGDTGSLREALIVNNAWPNVDDVRGQAIFLITSADYLTNVQNPSAFRLFDLATFNNDDDAVFLRVENANNNADVRTRSMEGYIIRSRADNPDDFVFPVPTDDDAGQNQIFAEYFAVFDRNSDNEVNSSEILSFAAAFGFTIDATATAFLERIVTDCSANNETFTLEEVSCVQTQTGILGSTFRLPPLPTDFISVADATTRRDGNLGSGSHLIATDHFVREAASDTGGYTAAFAAECEYYLNPASAACRSPPADFPEACRPYECFELLGGAHKNRLDQPIFLLVALVFSCALFM